MTVEACLARIAAREDVVHAWTYIDPEGARAQACERERDVVRGPLHGVTLGIKDIMDTADMPTAYGSPIYAGHKPAADAACVTLLRKAGAIVLGKTVTTEFATIHAFGKTRNPYDPARTPGGSSSGSAAAVADEMIDVALGTQTMGSVIRPAAYCGVVGFKPSFGSINRAGIKPQAESIDTVGIFGRTIGDVSPVAAVLTGALPESFGATLQRPPRIALYRGPDWSSVERPAEDALDAAAARLTEAGATIREVGDIELLRKALDAHLRIVVYELARALAYEWDRHRESISPVLAGLIEAGNACSFDEYIAAQAMAHAARDWIAGTFTETDLWLTVSAPGEAPLGDNTGDPVLNRVWSLLHLPVITLPAGRGPAGVPLGIQLIGAFRRDAALLAAARWIETQLQRSAHVESPSHS